MYKNRFGMRIVLGLHHVSNNRLASHEQEEIYMLPLLFHQSPPLLLITIKIETIMRFVAVPLL